MNYKVMPTNEVFVRVDPRNAGNFGIMRMSGQERSVEDEHRLAREIENQINRHVDDVERTEVISEKVYVVGNDEYESLYDMLLNELEYNGYYDFQYERPRDDGIKTRSHVSSFEELVERAFTNPHKFQLLSGTVTSEQEEFLNKVIEAGLNRQVQWVRV